MTIAAAGDSLPTLPASRLPGLVQQALQRSESETGTTVASQPGSTLSPAKRAAIHKGAEDYAGVFLSQMLEHMWSGVEVDQNFGGGHGEEMFRGLLVNEYGRMLAKGEGRSITDALYRELLRAQEG